MRAFLIIIDCTKGTRVRREKFQRTIRYGLSQTEKDVKTPFFSLRNADHAVNGRGYARLSAERWLRIVVRAVLMFIFRVFLSILNVLFVHSALKFLIRNEKVIIRTVETIIRNAEIVIRKRNISIRNKLFVIRTKDISSTNNHSSSALAGSSSARRK